MVTNSLFLWCTGLICAILLGFLIPMLIELIRIKGDMKLDLSHAKEEIKSELSHIREDIKPIGSLTGDIDRWLKQRGLEVPSDKPKIEIAHYSLPLDKASERDTLTKLRQTRGLTEVETNRLKTLLQEDANDDLAKGVIGVLAFLVLIAVINALTSKS